MAKFKKVTHCIFDMDGLLLDTESIYEEIVRTIVSSYNKPYPIEVRLKVMGASVRGAAETVVTELELPISIDEYLVRYDKLCKEMLRNSPLFKGAERLLRHLHDTKVPFALATSSSAEMFEAVTTKHREIFNLFNHRVCGSSDPEVKRGKPAPDIFLIAASRFADKPDPAQCLVFEDAPNGVQAAVSAGMQVVMVPDARVTQEVRAQATQALESLMDFKPEEFGLPAFSDGNSADCGCGCCK